MILKYKDFSYTNDYKQVVSIIESMDGSLYEFNLASTINTIKNVVGTVNKYAPMPMVSDIISTSTKLLGALGYHGMINKKEFEELAANYSILRQKFDKKFLDEYEKEIKAIDKILNKYIDQTASNVELDSEENIKAKQEELEKQIDELKVKAKTDPKSYRKTKQEVDKLTKQLHNLN